MVELPSLPDLPPLDDEIEETPIEKPIEKKKGRPKIPKSQYDSDGNPILTIPDLNDIDLTDEIDKYFGKEEY